MGVVWYQRDLRIPDYRELAASTADDTTLPVYMLENEVVESVDDRQRHRPPKQPQPDQQQCELAGGRRDRNTGYKRAQPVFKKPVES